MLKLSRAPDKTGQPVFGSQVADGKGGKDGGQVIELGGGACPPLWTIKAVRVVIVGASSGVTIEVGIAGVFSLLISDQNTNRAHFQGRPPCVPDSRNGMEAPRAGAFGWRRT